jgi:hypothetical protein
MSDLFANQVRELGDAFDDGDWTDVRRRARRVPTRALLIPVAAALAVVVVGSAFAIYRSTVDFFGGTPAPERIQRDFESLNARTSAHFGSPKLTMEWPAREVMRVPIDGEVRPYWVVPVREAGFCSRLHSYSDCYIPVTSSTPLVGASGPAAGDGGGLAWIKGVVTNGAVQRVELLYQDGERVQLRFVWVSAPIDAGFYAYDVPEEHEQPGHLTAAVVGLGADGQEVDHRCLPLPPDEVEASDAAVVALCRRPR